MRAPRWADWRWGAPWADRRAACWEYCSAGKKGDWRAAKMAASWGEMMAEWSAVSWVVRLVAG